MTHVNGQVFFKKDGLIMHYEYDGTGDTICNCLYDTHKNMHKQWRKQPTNKCDCGRDEIVFIANDYADGEYWEGTACRYCKSITSGVTSDDWWDIEIDGLPEWWEE